jgi:phosphatidylserine/phosphatidylglycerophosphate/cardiolipin synthase-like enzyme
MKKIKIAFIALLSSSIYRFEVQATDRLSPFTGGQALERISNLSSSTLKVTPSEMLKGRDYHVDAVKTISEQDLTEEEKDFIVNLGEKMDAGTLEPEVDRIFKILESRSNTLKNMNEAERNLSKIQLTEMIKANVKISRNNSLSWWQVSENMSRAFDSAIEKNPVYPASTSKELDLNFLHFTTNWNDNNSLFSPVTSLFTNSDSKAEPEITRAEEVIPEVNGEASFTKRDEIIAKAEKFINILTWSIYDDNTGQYLVDQVKTILKQKPNVKIRILVDGQTSELPGHGARVKELKQIDPRVELIEFYDRTSRGKNSYKGMHRKMLIVDGYHVIAGGMNYGDFYSHKGDPTTSQKWRDTDIYFRGGVAAFNAQKLFQKIWNEQIESHKLSLATLEDEDLIPASKTDENSPIVAILNSYPGENKDKVASDILMTHMYAIRRATTSIDIENAYLITVPIIRDEIKKALERNKNLQVRILTNSSASVDEKIVSTPILRSTKELASLDPHRVKVYLKKGSTLHSKFLVVDKQFTLVMSYNLHPRSERVEGEMAVAVLNKNIGQQFNDIFENDIQPENADLKSADQITIPDDLFLMAYITRIFFDVH